jgi:hypothetical protein
MQSFAQASFNPNRLVSRTLLLYLICIRARGFNMGIVPTEMPIPIDQPTWSLFSVE